MQVALDDVGHVAIEGTKTTAAAFFVGQLRAQRKRPSLEFVFLNCCHSFDLGRQLAAFVPYVVCWAGKDADEANGGGTITDTYAANFAAKFYEILAVQIDVNGCDGRLDMRETFERTIAWAKAERAST